MEIAANCQNTAETPPVRRRPKGYWKRSKPQLPVRGELDGRTNAARMFDAIVAELTTDLGGKEALSAVELRLIESFAGASVLAEAMNVRLLLGQEIDYTHFCAIASTLVRIGSRLGLRRRPRNVTPSLSEYLAARQANGEVKDDTGSFVSGLCEGDAP